MIRRIVMLASLWAGAAGAGPPPEKTVALDRVGRTQRCDVAPGLAGWLVGEPRVFSLERLLEDDTAKVRGVVVGFFATWCAPCREGLKRLQALQPHAEAAGVKIVLVAVPEFSEEPAEFLHKLGVTLPTVRDKFGSVWEQWFRTEPGDRPKVVLPRTVVLNEVGQLVAAFGQEGRDYEKRLRDVFAELPTRCRPGGASR